MRLRVSSGSAAALGLIDIRRGAEVTTAYVMIGEGGCAFSCTFCPQSRASHSSHRFLSRVSWPDYEAEDLVEHLLEVEARGEGPRRVCLQVVGSEHGRRDAEYFIRNYRSAGGTLPVSVNVAVFNVAAARKFFEAGADRLGLAVDAATPSLFRRHKLDRPGAWRGRMELLEKLARLYPNRVSTHFIAGLGETEEEMVGAMYRAIASGVTVALFAFTPVRGTLLEDRSAPDLASYRRMQLARFLMSERRARPEDFRFDEGAITAVGIEVAPEDLSRAFLTSGCPDCNRPYYNERPGETPYNYPRPPGWSEVVAAARAMGILYRIPEEFEEAKEVE